MLLAKSNRDKIDNRNGRRSAIFPSAKSSFLLLENRVTSHEEGEDVPGPSSGEDIVGNIL